MANKGAAAAAAAAIFAKRAVQQVFCASMWCPEGAEWTKCSHTTKHSAEAAVTVAAAAAAVQSVWPHWVVVVKERCILRLMLFLLDLAAVLANIEVGSGVAQPGDGSSSSSSKQRLLRKSPRQQQMTPKTAAPTQTNSARLCSEKNSARLCSNAKRWNMV